MSPTFAAYTILLYGIQWCSVRVKVFGTTTTTRERTVRDSIRTKVKNIPRQSSSFTIVSNAVNERGPIYAPYPDIYMNTLYVMPLRARWCTSTGCTSRLKDYLVSNVHIVRMKVCAPYFSRRRLCVCVCRVHSSRKWRNINQMNYFTIYTLTRTHTQSLWFGLIPCTINAQWRLNEMERRHKKYMYTNYCNKFHCRCISLILYFILIHWFWVFGKRVCARKVVAEKKEKPKSRCGRNRKMRLFFGWNQCTIVLAHTTQAFVGCVRTCIYIFNYRVFFLHSFVHSFVQSMMMIFPLRCRIGLGPADVKNKRNHFFFLLPLIFW